jgi:hypothetical protein
MDRLHFDQFNDGDAQNTFEERFSREIDTLR